MKSHRSTAPPSPTFQRCHATAPNSLPTLGHARSSPSGSRVPGAPMSLDRVGPTGRHRRCLLHHGPIDVMALQRAAAANRPKLPACRGPMVWSTLSCVTHSPFVACVLPRPSLGLYFDTFRSVHDDLFVVFHPKGFLYRAWRRLLAACLLPCSWLSRSFARPSASNSVPDLIDCLDVPPMANVQTLVSSRRNRMESSTDMSHDRRAACKGPGNLILGHTGPDPEPPNSAESVQARHLLVR